MQQTGGRRRTLIRLALMALIGATVFVAVPLSAHGASPTRPGPPTNVVATPVNTAIYTTWTAPTDNGGSPILYYVVSNVYNGSNDCVTPGPTTSCLSTGLTNGQSYTLRVRAVNAIGESTTVVLAPVTPNTTPNCNYIGPYANLQNCWLVGKNFSGLNLTGANLNGANVTYATFTGANLTGVTMTGTIINGITSGGITGTPAALPSGFGVVNGYLIGPGNGVTNVSFAGVTFTPVNLAGASMYGDNLSGTNLSAVTSFSGTNLSYDNFTNANFTGINLTGAILSGLTSGGITGTPAALPTGWGVEGGYLIGPGNGVTNVSFAGVTFGPVDLTGAAMYGDDYTNADLSAVTSTSGAVFDYSTWSNTVCPDGSNSSSYSPQTCIGHGI